jgi:uncharacterized protein YndB with AHSA1/START domain
MNALATRSPYGELIEPATLKIERVLPGPIERIWSYLVDSEMRRKWLASGTMEPKVGKPFELTWRNDELNDPPSRRPEGFGKEHSMKSHIVTFDPPHRLVFTWGEGERGEVSFELKQQDKDVLLTLIHRRIPDRTSMLNVSAGWHMHLDILVSRASGTEPSPFWDGWTRLKAEYEKRLPA